MSPMASGPSAPTDNPHKARSGLDRIVRATGHSAAGLLAAWRGEHAFRQETLLACVLLPAAFWLGRGWTEVALLVGSVVLVLVVELLNSAVEAVVDRVSYELHPLSKRAKDLGSAAVLLSLLFAAGVWAAALWHRFAAG